MGRLLNQAVDAGLNFFDTALSYGESEDRLRRHLGHRRSEILLSTKVGYGVPGHADWTPGCIEAGVDQALRNLGCEHLDVVHLHSCPVDVLENGGIIEPLQRAVADGKVRVAAYSGDNEALAWAVDSGAFGAVQASLNFVDIANRSTLQRAQDAGIGVLVKRPLANAPWRFEQRPDADDLRTYWDRWQALRAPDFGIDPAELALRFALGHSQVSACLVGTSKPKNLRSAVESAERGPLPDDILDALGARHREVAGEWPAMI